MPTLRIGSRGNDVRTLQNRLNSSLTPTPRLVPDGDFGRLTRAAVLRYQQANWLVEDGEVGPCTWNALMGTEAYPPILHRLSFIPQPTPTTCWAASTAMMTHCAIPVVLARTPSDLVLADGSLRNFADTPDPVTGANRFAGANSLRLVSAAASLMPSAFVALLRTGPVMVDMLWNAASYAQGAGSPGHMVVAIGIRGNNDPSGAATTVRFHDPWPPGQGNRVSLSYAEWIRDIPAATYHIYKNS